MALLISAGSEPIEGYRLIERLGKGGYGEVWKANAPGGFPKAIKFVFGDLSDERAQQELESLQRIKEVRHPFLVSLERVEFIDGRLVVVMEYAERSLRERFRQCQQDGLIGIPRNELLVYIQDTADALDYMNENYGLMHLDVKPQNVLLVGGRAKLADFGLVNTLSNGESLASRALTPAYGAPEAFIGKVSPFSDQYSLAIMYQELLTGRRPFPGSTALQLSIQHMQCPPYLAPLPPGDKPIIGRALSKLPERRFRSCKELAKELEKVEAGPLPSSARAGTTSPSTIVSRQTIKSTNLKSSLTGTEEMNTPSEIFDMTTSSKSINLEMTGSSQFDESVALADEMELAATLRPTLFIAAGSVGGMVMRRLRIAFEERFGSSTPCLRFLLLDTDPDSLHPYAQNHEADPLSADEKLLLPLYRPDEYRNRASGILRWLDRRWLYGIPRTLQTEHVRPLGRLAFIDNAGKFADRVRLILHDLGQSTARTRSQAISGLEVAEGPPRVVFVGSCAGATAGGIAVDLGYTVQQLLREFGFEDAMTIAYLIHSTSLKPTEREVARVNTYATFMELNHFNQPDVAYPGDSSVSIAPSAKGTSPFSETYVISLGDELTWNDVEQAVDPLIRYAYLDTVTPLSSKLMHYRRRTAYQDVPGEDRAFVRSFGVSELSVPRYQLATSATNLFFNRLVTHWRDNPGIIDGEQANHLGQEHARQMGLEPEQLLGQIRALVEQALGEPASDYVKAAFARGSLVTPNAKPGVKSDFHARRLSLLDGVFGIGPKAADVQIERGPLELEVLDLSKSISAKLDEQLSDWISLWIEEPTGRFGVAERFSGILMQQITRLQELLQQTQAERRDERLKTRARILVRDQVAPKSGWFSSTPKYTIEESDDLCLQYVMYRLAEITMEGALAVYRTLWNSLNTRIQSIQAIRGSLRNLLTNDRSPTTRKIIRRNVDTLDNFKRMLLSPTVKIEEVAFGMLDIVMPEALIEFDQNLQKEFRETNSSLCQVFDTGSLPDRIKRNIMSKIRGDMIQAFLQIDVAQLTQDMEAETKELDETLGQLMESSIPSVFRPGNRPHVFFAVPNTQAGQTILQRIRDRSPGLVSTSIASDGDIFIVRESPGLTVNEVIRSIFPSEANYVEQAQLALTRKDIRFVRSVPAF